MSSAADRAEGVRHRTLAVLTALMDEARTLALPEPPPGMEPMRRKLEDNTYQVLVVGEAKRGKSTLVNALIGRDILPTDVDIATSQVFRICPAQHEAYRLRFEDDSVQAITAADLPRYGSQVVADQGGAARLDAMIRWIEIDLPVKFLPPNVRILDTPGLGALYAAHALITHRFVPHADAVIFVLESQAPVGAPEIRFVEQLLGVTANVFFVQTKIDQFRREAWQEIQRRSQDILQKRFGGKLKDTRVWPVSSTNLAKVAATNDADYLQVSRYKELEAALQGFLFRVAGWDRAAVATVLAGEYHEQARAVLVRRLASLADDPAARPDAREWASRREQFASDWGKSGDAYQTLRGQVRDAANQAKRAFSQAVHSSSSLEMEQRGKIDKLTSADEATQHAARLCDDIVAAVSQRWRQAIEEFRSASAQALTPFCEANRLLDGLAAAGDPALSVQASQRLVLGGNRYRQTKAALREFGWVWGTASTAAGFAGAAGLVASGGLLLPAIIVAALGISILAAFRGWQDVGEKELKAAQQELHKHLTSVLAQIRLQFLGGDAGGGVVDDFFRTNVRELDHQVIRLVKKRLAEMDAEAVRLEENARLDAARREAKAEETRRQLQTWDGVGERIKEIQAELEDMDRDPTT
jgi:GTPase SAR1 family protein